MPRPARQDARSRILAAVNLRAWLPLIALEAGLRESAALGLLIELSHEGRVHRYREELWGRGQ